MKLPAVLQRRINWLNLPSAILMVLLQRMPVLSSVVATEEMLAVSPVGTILKAAVASIGALGAVNTMAGATPLSPSQGTAAGISVSAGSSVSVFYTVNGTETAPESWSVSGNIPAGLNFSGLTGSGGVAEVSTLQLSGTPTTAGSYSVTLQAFEFAGEGGISSPLYHYTITVTGSLNVAPSFSTQPVGQTVTEGASVTFTAAADGTPAPSFQWQKNGGDIGGATGTSYTIASTTTGDSGSYAVIATNAAGSVASNAAILTVNAATSPPGITQQPQSQTVTAGNSVTFSAAASGNPAPGYQWQKDGGDIGGATGSSFTIFNVSPGDAGSYSVVATNSAGSVSSGAAVLTVNVFPAITLQPQNQTVTAGSSVTFTGAASGTPTPSLQWQKNNGDIPGATGTSLTLNNVQLADAGSYTLIATNAAGVVASAAATLTVNAAPAFTTQPHDATVFLGGSAATFSMVATGSPAPTYQWQRLPAGSGTWGDLSNGGAYSGVTTAILTITGSTLGMSGDQFRCVATNVVGSATSNAATLTVVVPLPSITTQPASQTVALNAPLDLSVVASSPVALSYQWRKGSGDIGGATSSSYGIGSAQLSDAGSYTVVVTNSAGSVTSNTATVVVATPPVITGQPASQTTIAGNPATFAVTATSNVSLTYQWKKGGTAINGAVQNSYTIATPLPADAGDYTVVVSNGATSVTSNVATLTVSGSVPVFTSDPSDSIILLPGPTHFTVVADGLPSPTYQWQRLPVGSGSWANLSNGGVYSGATTTTLQLSSVTLAMTGDQFRCVASNVLGSATSNAATLTVVPAGFTKISAGRYHSLWLSATAELYASGTNTSGQLGNGTTASTNVPQLITIPGQTVVDISAGAVHSLFLTQAGELWATGLNDNGQLGDGTTAAKSTPIRIGTNIAGMAAGWTHSAFLKADGTLWTMGGNAAGQLGNGNTVDQLLPVQVATGVVDFSVGFSQTLFVKSDGTLWGTGNLYNNATRVSTPIQLAAGVRTVAAGGFHSLFIKTDATLWGVGLNNHGELGTGTPGILTTPVQVATGVKTVAAGYLHSLFIKTDATLWATGYNGSGQLGDGTVTNRLVPYQLATNVRAVSAHESCTLFSRADGTLWAAGYNGSGLFGNGSYADVNPAAQLSAGVLVPPDTSAGLTAVASAALDRIHLSWRPTLNATGYEVWRHTANDSSGATRLAADVRWPVYQDLTAVNGQVYYYWVKAVNSMGAGAFSAPASGAIGTPDVAPSVTADPQSQTVNVADNATFSVTASGTAPFTYQWRKDTVNIGSATASSYSLTGVTVNDAGSYDVVVTNSVDSVTSKAATLTVNKLGQTIAFTGPANQAYSATPLALSATASSGLTVTFSVVSGPASVTGSSLTLTGVGPVTVRASQSGDATYSAAPDIDQIFSVGQAAATVTLGNLTPTYDGTPKSATATTNPASLTVNFTYDGSATAPTNAGSYAVIGTISATLYQGSASGTLVIAKANQTITFSGPVNQAYRATPIALSATASSGLTVTFAVFTGPATVSGNSLTLTGAGSVTVRASQSGDTNYNAAPDADQSFTVGANFNSWAQSKFTAAELLDPNISGPNAVYGQDGLPNLVKYALGLEPKQNITTGLPTVGTVGSDWVYTYTRPDNIIDVTDEVEVSTDLVNWSSAGVIHELVSNTAGIDTWRGRYPLASAANVFFRLKVTQP